MKILYCIFLTILSLIAISSCEITPATLDYRLEGKLLWIDADGNSSVITMPAQFDSLREMRALPDGNLLIRARDFYVYYKATNTVTRIPTPNLLIPGEGSTFCLSRDGDAIFYCTDGKVWRKNLQSLEEECLVDSAGVTFFSPSQSGDGRYLAFLRKNHENYWVWQGYPLYLDLQTGIVHSLATGDEFLDSVVIDCWIDHFRSKYFFSTIVGYEDYHLNNMNMDGSGRAIVTEVIRKGVLTADGRYLLPKPNVAGSMAIGFYYRDFLSMLWTRMEDIGSFNIAFSGSVIYSYNPGEQRVYKHDLSTDEKQMLFDKYIIPDGKLYSVEHITPFRDDTGIYAVVTQKVDTEKDRE
ncbi:MAG: hypothetical protein CVU48_03070 [Candidatus Cloacimonetes bacterium HGW-Cloacimonetes-1]|nr:MAG: hypothetical protein CVU48_03070 [Candidatus Cloacimonetes bacterium HGW-Cloacimonetes-1]